MNAWCSRPKIIWQSRTAKERYSITARIFGELCNKCGIYFVDTRGTNRAVNRCQKANVMLVPSLFRFNVWFSFTMSNARKRKGLIHLGAPHMIIGNEWDNVKRMKMRILKGLCRDMLWKRLWCRMTGRETAHKGSEAHVILTKQNKDDLDWGEWRRVIWLWS